MSSASRQLRKLVTTKSHMHAADAPEAVEGLGKVMTAVATSSHAAANTSSARGLGMSTAKRSGNEESALSQTAADRNKHNITLSTAVIPGAPDPVRMLALTAEGVRNTTELHMGRKGLKLIHPNFQHFVNLEILWLNNNDLTAVQGLIPAVDAREALFDQFETAKGKKVNTTVASAASLLQSGARGAASPSNANGAQASGIAAAVQANPMSTTLLLMQNTAAFSSTTNTRGGGKASSSHAASADGGSMTGVRKVRGNKTSDGNSDDEMNLSSSAQEKSRIPPGALNAALAVPPRGCRRLKHLYLSDNRINTIEGDLQKLKYLETLLLANNLLTDMHGVSKKLRHLQCLKTLDLYGNPLCEQQGYRLYIIAHHPSVEILDRERVTDTERLQAKELFGNRRANYESLMTKGGALSNALQKSGGTFNMSSLVEKDSVGSSSAYGGNNAATKKANGDSSGSDGDEARQMSLKERVTQQAPIGFGTTVPPAKPMRKAEAISASVAILESRCSMIQAEQVAARRRAKDKEAAELGELAEQRRLFHHAWEAAAARQEKLQQEAQSNYEALLLQQQQLMEASTSMSKKRGGGSGSAPPISGPAGGSPAASSKSVGGNKAAHVAQQQQQRTEQLQQQVLAEYSRIQALAAHQRSLANEKERLVSRIFHLDSEKALDPKIVELIELQRRREEAANIGDEDQLLAIDEEMVEKQCNLLPMRDRDVFKEAMEADNAATEEGDAKRYNTHIVEKVLLFPSELALVKKSFSERGSVFSLDRLRHLLMASVSIANAGGRAASLASAVPPPSSQSGKRPGSADTSTSTSTSFLSGNAVANAVLSPSVVDTIRNAFISKYPAGPELDSLKLPIIRSNNRAMSVVSTGSNGSSGRKGPVPPASPPSPSLSASNTTKRVGKGAAAAANASAAAVPTTALENSKGTSFSVDTAMFMAMRDMTNTESGLMTPISVYDALILLSRVPAFVVAKQALVEQLALEAMQKHEYTKLKEYQQRINDLSTHLAALKQNSSFGHADALTLKHLQSKQQEAPKRYSSASSTFSATAFAAASKAATASPASLLSGNDAASLSPAQLNNAAAALTNQGYVELKNVKALWGAVQVRQKERSGDARFKESGGSEPATPTPQPQAAAPNATSNSSPLPPAGKKKH